VVGDEVGTASAVKMSTAAVYKGTSALLAQALVAAQANGVVEQVLDDLRAGAPELVANLERRLTSSASKSGRYVGEMREIATTQKAAGLTPALFEAMAEVFGSLSATELARATFPEDLPEGLPLAQVLDRLR
jgi:3-hydroxyisobutyrate dehydrogenase-like beta-hydroxyacid dehydrogenase